MDTWLLHNLQGLERVKLFDGQHCQVREGPCSEEAPEGRSLPSWASCRLACWLRCDGIVSEPAAPPVASTSIRTITSLSGAAYRPFIDLCSHSQYSCTYESVLNLDRLILQLGSGAACSLTYESTALRCTVQSSIRTYSIRFDCVYGL